MAKWCYSLVSVWCNFIVFVIFEGLNHQGVSAELLYTKAGTPSTDFSRHTLIKPKIYHGREKRQISTTKEEDGNHARDLTIGYVSDGKEYVLELRLNRELVPADFFVRYQHEGKHIVNRPTGKDVELCQYVGVVRGMKNSWAALSTCKGLKGVVFDGKTMHYLQSGDDNDLESPHFLYTHEDLVTNHTCGYTGDSSHLKDKTSAHHDHQHDDDNFSLGKNHKEFNRILRYKRSASEPEIRGPYNANKMSRYVELVLVVDNKEYRELGESLSEVHNHCKDIANIINSLYAPLNIFIALVGVVVWNTYDEITLSSNGDTTLTNFLHYRRQKLSKDHPNDNAQLLTREQFVGGVVGKALKGPICTYEFSGGVAMDHSNVVGLVATTIAHEMGHNFGMEHDTDECSCPEERCIMSPSSNSQSPTHWSSCSLEYLALAFEHGMDYCLRNKPVRLFDSPVCGNGFVESGEQCDCGMPGSCEGNNCCNPKTCMLFPNATCATGECCDLQTCRPASAGTQCRTADHECDLPEFCTGQSEFCPEDVFKMDTETCDNGKAFCYHGSCRTKSDQCRLLWGPTGKSSDNQCYEMNKKGTRHGNCGFNRLKQNYSRCQGENVLCGMLHCTHLNERLEFGMESVATLSHSFINNNGAIIACRTAIVDLGLNQIDPGLVPDGAKCGEEKMCVNQKCMAVASLRLGAQANPLSGAVCPSDCSGHGVCNSLGHCHCEKGFAPPLCDSPGPGGSLDSGPASDPNAHKVVMKVLLITFLGIIPSILLIAFLVHYSRQNSIMFWKKPKGSSSSKSPMKGGIQRRLSRGAGCLALCGPSPSAPATLSPASPRLSPDDMNSSLLTRSQPSHTLPHNNNFFGHFKGYSLAPIAKQEDAFGVQNSNFGIDGEQNPSVSTFTSPNSVKSIAQAINGRGPNHVAQINRGNGPQSPDGSNRLPPQRAAPPVPSVPAVAIKVPGVHRSNTAASASNSRPATNAANRPKSVVAGVENINSTSMAPALPPMNLVSHGSRPVISDPILEASTCTAKELISPLKNSSGSGGIVPMRTAPVPPSLRASSPPVNKRPLSSPGSVTDAVFCLPEEPVVKKPKESSALNRIASFLKQDRSSDKEKNRNPVERSNSLPKNPNHRVKVVKALDKGALRNLQISNPILMTDVDRNGNEDDTDGSFVGRTQSMRSPTPATKPNVPSFGSMRQPAGARRPTSIPVGNRPTSPPPPRPDLKPDGAPSMTKNFGIAARRNMPIRDLKSSESDAGPQYDDCVAETHAPLANINEESSPDNIYAVIEETPLSAVVSAKRIPGMADAAPSDTSGLLGEIVSEIQNRNLDSIYSTSTLARKKKEKELRAEKNGGVMSDDEADFGEDMSGTYANTAHYPASSAASTTSSGYLNPSAVNVPVGKIPPKSGIVSINATTADQINTRNNIPPMKPAETDQAVKPKIGSEPYKPFSSSLHRSLGPFASSYTKDKSLNSNTETTDRKAPEKVISPPSNTKVPILARQVTPDSLQNKIPTSGISRQPTPPYLKNITQVQRSLRASSGGQSDPIKDSKDNSKTTESTESRLIVNSPDLVSSCAPTANTLKSPDVVSGNSQNGIPTAATKPSTVNQGVVLKPTLQPVPIANKSTFGQLSKQLPASKPLVKQNSKTGLSLNNQSDPKTTLRTAPPPPASNDKKKIVPPRPTLPKVILENNSSKTNSIPSLKTTNGDKTLSSISKINSDKQKPAIKSQTSTTKSDIPKSQASSIAARSAALSSKVSNVANLQQKFETSKIGQGGKTSVNTAKKA